MKQKTQYYSLWAYADDVEAMRALRGRLQAQYPDHTVTMADVLKLAVSSADAVLPPGGTPPVAISRPRPPIGENDAA